MKIDWVYSYNFSLLYDTQSSPTVLSSSHSNFTLKDRSKKAFPVITQPIWWRFIKHLSRHGVGQLWPTLLEWLGRKINAGKPGVLYAKLYLSTHLKTPLQEYLIFDDISSKTLFEHFPSEKLYGQKGLRPWGRGLMFWLLILCLLFI